MKSTQFDVAVCAYCHTGHEVNYAKLINKSPSVRAIVPMRIRRDREQGRWIDKEIKMLPSYLFIYGFGDNALENLTDSIRNCKLHLVEYNDDEVCLRGDDLSFARWIYEHDGVIGVSGAVHEGDSIRIVEGVLKDMKGVIRRIDRRHRLVQVQLELQNMLLWLSYDWVE